MDINKSRNRTKPIKVAFDDDTLNVEYYVRAVKLRDLHDTPDTTDQSAVVDFTAAMLARRVATWDLVDGDTPVPVTYEAILDLPPELVNAILAAINEDGRPGEATGSN